MKCLRSECNEGCDWCIYVTVVTCADTLTSTLCGASAPRLVQQSPWYVLSCLWDGAYKRTLAVNR